MCRPTLCLSYFILWVVLTSLSPLAAQPGRTTLVAPTIKTLRLTVDDDPTRLPILKLGGTERLEVSFDEFSHEYHRFTYRLEHCDYKGDQTDNIFESDYVQSAAESEVIEDYTTSVNTTVLYTHYRFELPNARMRPLLAGNYKLIVETEDDEGEIRPVIETYFAVLSPSTKIGIRLSSDTEIDLRDRHQQLTLTVDCEGLGLRDGAEEIKTVVLQNHRYDNARFAVPPTAQNASSLLWEHCRPFIFTAGNEYRRMEMVSTRYPGMHGDVMRWHDPFYHYILMEDEPRRNYLYDEDQDGLFLIKCENSGDPDSEADYVMTHFSLLMPPIADGNVYVAGRFAATGLSSAYRMEYNDRNAAYEAVIPLKMGYYNYQYLVTNDRLQGVGTTAKTEGDYYQTENKYTVLVYYRPTGGRYWSLAGLAEAIYKP